MLDSAWQISVRATNQHALGVELQHKQHHEVGANGRLRRTSIYGVGPQMLDVFKGKVRTGQFLPPDDASSARALVVLGPKLKDELFREGMNGWRKSVAK